MGFFDDVVNTVKQAVKQPGNAAADLAGYYTTAVQAPYLWAGNKAVKTIAPNSKELAYANRVFQNSYNPSLTYGLSDGLISGVKSGDFNQFRAEKRDWLTGATVASGVAGASALAAGGAAATQFDRTGTVNTSSVLAAFGVDPEVASLFPSIDLGMGDGAKVNPVPGTTGAKRASYSPLPLGGEDNSYMLPIVLIGGAALMALAFYGRK